MLVHMASSPSRNMANSTLLFTDMADFQQILQFPSLRTTTTVSWCFLNYTKPNFVQQATFKSSVYASWCISSCNPNPSGLNTKTTLALLRSKQKITAEIYTLAAMHRPGTGKLTSSSAWKQFTQVKPDGSFLFGSKLERKLVGNILKERGKGEIHGDKDIGSKQNEPIRIKIFEGGYKSNEDYVYVRGRGRGKYICEECGIRCKKPSMLKKHIRTHTDVRPYVCKLCNFAFKTKGNLTKHMKSKAHMKKCLELGVSMTSVDDTETEEAENMEDLHKTAEKHSMSSISTDHQFSDAEESDGEDGDDNDDDDEDDDDFDDQGDMTPKTRSRSTSPQPPRFSSLPVNVGTVPHGVPSDSSLGHSSLISYLVTLPSIQVTQLMTSSDSCEDTQMTEYQRLFQSKSTDSEPDKDREVLLSVWLWHCSSRVIAPGQECIPICTGFLRSRKEGSPAVNTAAARIESQKSLAFRVSGGQNLRRGLPQVPYFSLYGDQEGAYGHQGSSLFPEGPNDHVFSHLPLHSQQQVRAPIPMVPVGGIQMVHSVPPALSGLHPPPTSPLPVEGSMEKKAAPRESFGKDPYALPRQYEKWAPHILQSSGLPGTPSSPRLLMKQSTSEDSLNATEREQEENIQTCTKAIASLRIATEEAALLGADQPARGQEPSQKPLESAHVSIRHFSGPESAQPCTSAAHPDLHDGEKDNFGTTQTALTHSTFYSKSRVDEKQSDFHSSKELSLSTEESNEPSSEKSQLH
ncbi:Transcription factor HIVEP2 [Heterocephalus glaber]|uniref:Transcription factor HIVEP2 n=1 Tax=Heterocephalus glaber TaxID=10181 RepID=G5BL52_HETGA|nr:Transcription factor HIVEP2 [Heterocephalus glaber]